MTKDAAQDGRRQDHLFAEANAYGRFYGDPDIKSNPCVAPLEKPRFYAVRVEIGGFGTYAHIVTSGNARALEENKRPIPSLFPAGNEALSMTAGNCLARIITLGSAMTCA